MWMALLEGRAVNGRRGPVHVIAGLTAIRTDAPQAHQRRLREYSHRRVRGLKDFV
jgi:hypothetical protein